MFFSVTALNINLLAIGVTIAAIGILGFVAFFSNSKSATNRAFLILAIFTITYSVTNYISYQLDVPSVTLWVLRFTIFFAVWHAFSFFHFAYVFPNESLVYPAVYKWLLVPFITLVSVLTLTPLMFPSVEKQGAIGGASQAVLGPAIPLFGITAFGLVVCALFLIMKKTLKAKELEKKQFFFILGGAAITFALLIAFNLVLPIVFQQVRYIPLAALFFFPFIAFTTYAILKHHLLNMKVISTEILAFALSVVTFSEAIFSKSIPQTLFRSGEFVLVLIFGIFLIKSVIKEVEQREELQRLYKQLEEKNKQLDELSHFKSELLSLASHQIRSPLAAMKGFTSLIMDGTYGAIDPRAKEAMGKVQRSADELIGLINTLLDMRKVEEGKMEYQFAKTDLTKLADDVVGLLRPLAETKNLQFTFDSPGHEVWVNADGEKLKQVIQNLTDNAIKYTPNGFVKVELREEAPLPGAGAGAGSARAAILTVSDSGLGVPADLIPHLFEEFIRDERVKKEIRGTGLGLYIARKIAEAHGGTVWAESAGEGKGSVFHLRVPLAK